MLARCGPHGCPPREAVKPTGEQHDHRASVSSSATPPRRLDVPQRSLAVRPRPGAEWSSPAAVTWDREIVVPFAPETEASGVEEMGFFRACWYRRTFDAPALAAGERLILHFGAVDYRATVWVNGTEVARHEGGYTPFAADITTALDGEGPQRVVVRVEDDPQDLTQPRGKQDWELQPHSIWYPRTTGIWQTVWPERVSATSIGRLRWAANLERWEADVLGLLVWEEMPSAYRYTARSIDRLTREWTAAIERDASHHPYRRLGAVQRVLGRPGPDGPAGAAALRSGAVSPH